MTQRDLLWAAVGASRLKVTKSSRVSEEAVMRPGQGNDIALLGNDEASDDCVPILRTFCHGEGTEVGNRPSRLGGVCHPARGSPRGKGERRSCLTNLGGRVGRLDGWAVSRLCERYGAIPEDGWLPAEWQYLEEVARQASILEAPSILASSPTRGTAIAQGLDHLECLTGRSTAPFTQSIYSTRTDTYIHTHQIPADAAHPSTPPKKPLYLSLIHI